MLNEGRRRDIAGKVLRPLVRLVARTSGYGFHQGFADKIRIGLAAHTYRLGEPCP